MIGREVIETEKEYDASSLYNLFCKHWDYEKYGSFEMGNPSLVPVEEYVCIPATDHFMIIVYGRKSGWFFSKKNKVILTVCENEKGQAERFNTIDFSGRNPRYDITSMLEEERIGPAQDKLIDYTLYVADILYEDGDNKDE